MNAIEHVAHAIIGTIIVLAVYWWAFDRADQFYAQQELIWQEGY